MAVYFAISSLPPKKTPEKFNKRIYSDPQMSSYHTVTSEKLFRITKLLWFQIYLWDYNTVYSRGPSGNDLNKLHLGFKRIKKMVGLSSEN